MDTKTQTYTIAFTDVKDARFPGRHILIGEVAGTRFYASYASRREAAERAIHKQFADAYAACDTLS